MTIREFLRTVWAGKYYVLVAVLVVMIGAALYVERQDPVFEATATVQIVAAESVPGANQQAASVTVDTDPEAVRAPDVVEPAAAALADGTDPRTLAGAVQGFYNADLLTMDVIAQAGDEASAVRRANAAAQAYIAYLPTILDTQIAALDERRDALRAQLDAIQGGLAATPDDPLAQAERDTIVGQYQAISALHSTYESIVTPGVLVDPATSAVPLGMPTPLVLAIALLAGLVAGVGLAFARRGLDLRVRTTAEAAVLAGTPVLAELFDVRGADKEFRRTGNLPVSSRHASPFTESVRELRTAVRVSLGDAPHAVAVVTAADPHAPRAFITANLAASFALSGRPTIVLCGDLRRPQLADLLPAPAGWDGSPRELRPTRIPNLRLMPVHDDEMDPADFLATARVRALVEGLREKAAIVVIDAPPVLAAADATILGGYANGVVLIASVEKTDRAVLQEAAERLRINNVPLSGMALSGVKGDRRMTYASSYGTDAPLTAAAEQERADESSESAPPAVATDAAAPENTAAAPENTADVTENAAPESRAATRTRKESTREAARRLEPQWAKVPPSEAESIDGEDAEEDAPNIRRRPFRW